ncbi:MAG: hypothetical protein LBF62_12565 [Tannerellaceae bacterium]|jgi:hypothetical protein|nr:hypothetical protein [Tannerellaceae bacterium]
MRRLRYLAPIGFLLVIAGFGAVVMSLWNWLMPALFGLAAIGYWQAMGLFVLTRLLIGNIGPGHGRMMAMDPVRRKWMKMTPEEREEFINRRRRFGYGASCFREPFGNISHEEHSGENE